MVFKHQSVHQWQRHLLGREGQMDWTETLHRWVILCLECHWNSMGPPPFRRSCNSCPITIGFQWRRDGRLILRFAEVIPIGRQQHDWLAEATILHKLAPANIAFGTHQGFARVGEIPARLAPGNITLVMLVKVIMVGDGSSRLDATVEGSSLTLGSGLLVIRSIYH
jgi:hypothetical protein